MIYILDTADLSAIRRAVEFYPIDGVTTNPSIIAKQKGDFKAIITQIRQIIGPDKMLHVQAVEESAEGIVEEAKALKALLGENFYIKVPIGEEGLKATMMLSAMGINVTMTAIFTPQQALLAAKAGAAFVAPYVNRIDNVCANGVGVVADIVATLDHFGLNTRVLAASFKNCEQVHQCALVGCHSVTVAPDVLFALIAHPMTDAALAGFQRDWHGVYGDKKVRDLL